MNKNIYTSELISTDNDYQQYSSELLGYTDISTNIQISNGNETIQSIINNMLGEFKDNKLDTGIIQRFLDENKIIILTTTYEQKYKEDNNNITINLGECENILKDEYNISKNDSLYILQIILEEQGMKIPKVEYEVYYPLYNNDTLTKLNLTLCKGTKIEISIPVKIDGPIDLYNPKSGYYNDICYIVTSENGTDITLQDRRNEFVDNNMALCEENCELIEYNYEKEKSKCSCDIKTSIPDNYEIKFNKNEFFKSFKDINNIINLNVMKCYKVVFRIKGLIRNYGFFIMNSIIIFYFISLLIFITVSNDKMKKEVNKIIFALKFNEIPIKNIKNIKSEQLKDKPTIIKKRKKKKRKKIVKLLILLINPWTKKIIRFKQNKWRKKRNSF